MRRLALALCLIGVATPAWAAVAFVSNTNTDPSQAVGTGGTYTMVLSTVGTSSPVLLVTSTVTDVVHANGNTTSVSSSIDGAFTLVKSVTDSQNSTSAVSVWCLRNPSSGSHTVTVTITQADNVRGDVSLFSGADATTPCPTGDAVSDGSTNSTSITLTPTNLATGDASYGSCSSNGAVPSTAGPNQINLETTGGYPVMATAYGLNTTGTTITGNSTWALQHSCVTARIAKSAATTPVRHRAISQ